MGTIRVIVEDILTLIGVGAAVGLELASFVFAFKYEGEVVGFGESEVFVVGWYRDRIYDWSLL